MKLREVNCRKEQLSPKMQLHQILYAIRSVGPSGEERVEVSFEKELTPSVNQETSKD